MAPLAWLTWGAILSATQSASSRSQTCILGGPLPSHCIRAETVPLSPTAAPTASNTSGNTSNNTSSNSSNTSSPQTWETLLPLVVNRGVAVEWHGLVCILGGQADPSQFRCLTTADTWYDPALHTSALQFPTLPNPRVSFGAVVLPSPSRQTGKLCVLGGRGSVSGELVYHRHVDCLGSSSDSWVGTTGYALPSYSPPSTLAPGLLSGGVAAFGVLRRSPRPSNNFCLIGGLSVDDLGLPRVERRTACFDGAWTWSPDLVTPASDFGAPVALPVQPHRQWCVLGGVTDYTGSANWIASTTVQCLNDTAAMWVVHAHLTLPVPVMGHAIFHNSAGSVCFAGGLSAPAVPQVNTYCLVDNGWRLDEPMPQWHEYAVVLVRDDADADWVGDYDDVDADNDGVPDECEVARVGWVWGGLPDYTDESVMPWTDSNHDGVNDYLDWDLDGLPDHLDLDSQGAGLLDIVRVGGSDRALALDLNSDGIIDPEVFVDVNADGWHDDIATQPFICPNGPDTAIQVFYSGTEQIIRLRSPVGLVSITIPANMLSPDHSVTVNFDKNHSSASSPLGPYAAMQYVLSISLVSNGMTAKHGTVSLPVPIEMALPVAPQAGFTVIGVGWWSQDSLRWLQSGCVSDVELDGYVVASCTHLTEFAVLLERITDCTLNLSPLKMVISQIFLSFYSVICLYCVFVTVALTLTTCGHPNKQKLDLGRSRRLQLVHGFVGASALSRLLACLDQMGYFGACMPALTATITSLPYAFEVITFTLVAEGWAEVLRSAAKFDREVKAWLKMRWLFTVLSVLSFAGVVVLVILVLAVPPKSTVIMAVAGQSTLTLLSLTLALLFFVSSRQFARTVGAGQARSAVSNIALAGLLVCVSFILQTLVAGLALTLGVAHLQVEHAIDKAVDRNVVMAVFSALYFTCNCATLAILLSLYAKAVRADVASTLASRKLSSRSTTTHSRNSSRSKSSRASSIAGSHGPRRGTLRDDSWPRSVNRHGVGSAAAIERAHEGRPPVLRPSSNPASSSEQSVVRPPARPKHDRFLSVESINSPRSSIGSARSSESQRPSLSMYAPSALPRTQSSRSWAHALHSTRPKPQEPRKAPAHSRTQSSVQRLVQRYNDKEKEASQLDHRQTS